MVLPLLKVGSLLVKSLAKPLSKQIKYTASKSKGFHDGIVKWSRIWYKFDSKIAKFSGDNTRRAAELNVNAAIDLGTEIVSEAFLLTVAIGLLLYENSRSSEKEKKKEDTLKERFKSIEEQLETQQETINNLTNILQGIQSTNPNLNIFINDPSSPTSSKSFLDYINNNNNNNSKINTNVIANDTNNETNNDTNDFRSLTNEGIYNNKRSSV